jgi:hypothetical protein
MKRLTQRQPTFPNERNKQMEADGSSMEQPVPIESRNETRSSSETVSLRTLTRTFIQETYSENDRVLFKASKETSVSDAIPESGDDAGKPTLIPKSLVKGVWIVSLGSGTGIFGSFDGMEGRKEKVLIEVGLV